MNAEDGFSTDGYARAVAEASEEDGYDMDGLDGKLLEHFGGKIVRKDLTAFMKRGANVPLLCAGVPAGHVLLDR